jgi:hypothetical protein
MYDEPRDDSPAFGERHTDEHERQDFAEHSRIPRHGRDTASRGDADANGRAAKGETDVNVTLNDRGYCICEHHNFILSIVWLSLQF